MKPVISIEELEHELFLNSVQGRHIQAFLKRLGAKTVVIEPDYIDKDFLLDYQKFYCRSFYAPDRKTTRLHFFKDKQFSQEDFVNYLKSGEIDELISNYLGFSVIKPMENKNGEKLIGYTILDPCRGQDVPPNNTFLRIEKKLSLYGIPLEILGLPYQNQDRRVSACATAAIWVSQYPLNNLFSVKTRSPCEIREEAIITPSIYRSFPTSGLSLQQMISYFKSNNLDVEQIGIRDDEDNLLVDPKIIEDVIKAYLHCGLPVIAKLILKKPGSEDGYHAVVISGYETGNNGSITKIYIHDDGIGPYTKTKLGTDMSDWKNEWTEEYGYSKVLVDWLLIPIYPKVRITFPRMYKLYTDRSLRSTSIKFDIILSQLNQYKEYLLDKSVEDKEKILSTGFPRFLWIIRSSYNGVPIEDHIYDGTSVFPKEIATVKYL